MLGTWISIEAEGATCEQCLQAIEAAFEAIRDVERCLHPFEAASDLQRIGAAKPGEQIPVDRHTWEVLRFSMRVHRVSGGIFDPCTPDAPGTLRALLLSPAARDTSEPFWVSPRVAIRLDCGGVAKGYAVDCAVEALRAAGCLCGLVNAGGDLRSFGPRGDTVVLRREHDSRHPSQPGNTLMLRDAALAVSQVDAPGRPTQHRGYYVRTRAHATGGHRAATRDFAAVLAPSAMVADALTKCVLLSAPEATTRLLRHFVARGV